MVHFVEDGESGSTGIVDFIDIGVDLAQVEVGEVQLEYFLDYLADDGVSKELAFFSCNNLIDNFDYTSFNIVHLEELVQDSPIELDIVVRGVCGDDFDLHKEEAIVRLVVEVY